MSEPQDACAALLER